MFEKRPKRHRRYIFYRIYGPVVWVSVLVWGIFWLITAATNQEPSTIQMITFGILFPCFAVDVFMLMSLFVFPFEYSILGAMERRHFPEEDPILKQTGTWGMISLFHATIPFFSWYVYPSGLGISILGIGKVFIPTGQIKKLSEERGLRFFTGRYMLQHTSPELYNPVYLPNKRIFEALEVLLPPEVTA